MELNEFDFNIVHRSGKLNSAPDALSRVYCASMHGTALHDIHASLCHLGITLLHHFVRVKNLPYSVEDVCQTVRDCSMCSELKPNFYKPPAAQATQPFERLSSDFKGRFPSSAKNRYMLAVIDEFSRFAFPCVSVDAKTLISCLNHLFTLFGMPAYIHSDRGTAFMLHALASYLHRHGDACSNPIWSAVQLALASRKLAVTQWECVLPDVLHSIRSLLCTAMNTNHMSDYSIRRGDRPLGFLYLLEFCTG